jgi:hypothetical protein
MFIIFGILFIIVVYVYLVKFLFLNDYISRMNPKLGAIMETLNTYTGANVAQRYLARKGYFGPVKQEDALEREFTIVGEELKDHYTSDDSISF